MELSIVQEQGQIESTASNMRLAQWRVKWLIEHSTSYQLLWYIDSFFCSEIRHCAKRRNVIAKFKQTPKQKLSE